MHLFCYHRLLTASDVVIAIDTATEGGQHRQGTELRSVPWRWSYHGCHRGGEEKAPTGLDALFVYDLRWRARRWRASTASDGGGRAWGRERVLRDTGGGGGHHGFVPVIYFLGCGREGVKETRGKKPSNGCAWGDMRVARRPAKFWAGRTGAYHCPTYLVVRMSSSRMGESRHLVVSLCSIDATFDCLIRCALMVTLTSCLHGELISHHHI